MFQGSDDEEDFMPGPVDYLSTTAPQVISPPAFAPEQQVPVAPSALPPPAPVQQFSPPPRPAPAPAPMPMPIVQVVPAQAQVADPDVTERAHMLGFGLIASSLGAVAGLRIGGVYGGVAGTLFAGSAVNLYRAAMHASRGTPEGNREAIVSGTYSLIAAGLGGYISYKTGEWGKDVSRERTYAPPLIANRKGLKGFY